MQIKIGQYSGNGSDNRSITGVGFQPDILMISRNDANSTQLKNASQPADASVPIGSDFGELSNIVQAFESDGFQVGSDSASNSASAGATYEYMAIKDNGEDDVAWGTYTGNGSDNRDVVTGLAFQPEVVVVKRRNGNDRAVWRHASQTGDNSLPFIETGETSNLIQAINADGFEVGTSAQVNSNSQTYMWIAFKAVSGLVNVSTYSGNGSDNRNITGIGYDPELVWVKESGGGDRHTFHAFANWSTNESKPFSGWGWPIADVIQDCITDGFQVGLTRINHSGVTNYYVTFDSGESGGTAYTPTLTEAFTIVDTLPKLTSRYLTDTTTLVDTLPKGISRILSDAFTLVDVIIKAPSRILSDVVSLVDSIIKGLTFTEIITLVDSVPRTISRTLTDVATLVDSHIKSAGRTLSEVATLVDTFTGKLDGRILTETVTLVDTTVKSISRTLTDVATLVDSVPKTVGRTLSDVMTLVDTIVAGFGKELLETISLIETHLRSVARTLTDTTTLVDAALKAPQRILSDVFTLTDSIEKSVGKTLSEIVSLIESLPRTITRTLTDTATLVDTFTSNMTATLTAVLTETLTLVDTTVRATNKLLTEAISLQDWVWQKVVKGSANFIKQTISNAIWRKEA